MLNKVKAFVLGDKRRFAAILGIAILLLALITIGLVYASYVRNLKSDGYARMKEFYFTSNLLDGKTHTLAEGSTSVTFTLGNHADELRYSEVGIEYSVEVEDLTVSSSEVSIINGSGVLSSGAVNNASITVNNLISGHRYKITATGDGGYHQVLEAIIVVPQVEAKLYYYLDISNDEFVILTVWANGYTGPVTISTPTSVAPDNTDSLMRNVHSGDEFTDETTFISDGHSSHSYRFFGNGVTVNDFTVSGSGDVSATVMRPV